MLKIASQDGDIMTISSLVGVTLCLYERLLKTAMSHEIQTSSFSIYERVSLLISSVSHSDSSSTIASSLGKDEDDQEIIQPCPKCPKQGTPILSNRFVRLQFDWNVCPLTFCCVFSHLFISRLYNSMMTS